MDELASTLARARERLLADRNPEGTWTGELSSSALSTATAMLALWRLDEHRHEKLISAGLAWLTQHANTDGGWGDTTQSPSNIAATLLAWSALAAGEERVDCRQAICGAEVWLTRTAGSTSPDDIVAAVQRRYGADRTFAVPILLAATMAGRLGLPRDAWRRVVALPLELSVMPRPLLGRLRLGVVSYALPALIAIGLARFRNRPPANPVTRLIRKLAAKPALRKLREIQPAGGGFLEAAPLTSFTVLGLVAAGEADSPVVSEAAGFLARTVRADGSWPIDTNLATWVTSLAVCAMNDGGPAITGEARDALRRELLARQCMTVHPYTGSAAGGWAWTNLPGAVPDADDTASALRALRTLTNGEPDDATLRAAHAGADWLLGLQNRDGGMPTFCRGWGKLPFDRGTPDLTANAVQAWLAWRDLLPAENRSRIDAGLAKASRYLIGVQEHAGSFRPLWFGNDASADEANRVYGTSRAIGALAKLAIDSPAACESLIRATQWLMNAQDIDGGWGGDAGVASSVEETALSVEALATAAESGLTHGVPGLRDAIELGVDWLIEHTDEGRDWPVRAIGLYFASLWYFERLYPLIFTTAALSRALRILQV